MIFFLLYFCGAFLLAVGGWDCTDIDFEIIAFVLINVIIVVKIGEKNNNKKKTKKQCNPEFLNRQ